MRSRVPRSPGKVLAAGAIAALLGLSTAGSAAAAGPKAGLFSLSGGAPTPTNANCTGTGAQGCAEAGYQASGRDFRYAQAVITVPDHPGVVTATAPAEADPQLYVGLADSPDGTGQPPGSPRETPGSLRETPGTVAGEFARVGLRPCTGGAPCGSSGWEAFAEVRNGSTPPTGPPFLAAIAAADEGDGVFVSVYLDPSGRSVHTVITLPDGSTFNNTFPDRGAVYPRAQAVADWTTATTKPQPVAPSPDKVRDAQFLEGRFTTLNGQQGTFAGPWALNAFEGTANGALPPTGTLIAAPSYLWNDETNFHGRFGDAFGVWRFPFLPGGPRCRPGSHAGRPAIACSTSWPPRRRSGPRSRWSSRCCWPWRSPPRSSSSSGSLSPEPRPGHRPRTCPAHHEPQARPGAGSAGGVRKAGGPSRSSASSGAAAAASRAVSGGRFHFCPSSFSTAVWSKTWLVT